MGDGNVEKSRQRRSRPFAVLTYYEYAPRVKTAAALPVDGRVLARLGWAGQTTNFFEHSPQQMLLVSSWACIGHWCKIFNSHNNLKIPLTPFSKGGPLLGNP